VVFSSRLRHDLIEGEVKITNIFKTKLVNRGMDDSKKGIPKSILNKVPIVLSTSEDPKEIEQFKGFYHILDLVENREKDEILAIAWNENNNSTWLLNFDSAYKPALEESVKIKITSGKIIGINKANIAIFIVGKLRLIIHEPARLTNPHQITV